MTNPATTPASPSAPRRRPRLRLLVGLAVAGVVVVGAFAFRYAYLRPVPAAVSLPAASAAGSAAPGASVAVGGGSSAGLSGTWSVDPSIGSFADFMNSFVGDRVQEVLAQIGSTTALGRTADVTGTLTIDDTTLTAVEIEADLTTLRSDSSMRDGQLAARAWRPISSPPGRPC